MTSDRSAYFYVAWIFLWPRTERLAFMSCSNNGTGCRCDFIACSPALNVPLWNHFGIKQAQALIHSGTKMVPGLFPSTWLNPPSQLALPPYVITQDSMTETIQQREPEIEVGF